ncbi:autotransporter [Baekduia sp. Peel2402]|uniref:autotransporter n=1 Tax=Baekduia sp. Peel2402 TaxID=3458296 RepID=UPI00403EC834
MTRKLLVVLASLAVAAPAVAATGEHAVKEHVDLTLVKRTGTTKLEHKGRATGTVKGAVTSKITISHSVVMRGTVTISAAGGKIRLKVSGRARSIGVQTKFNGTATMSGGTGKYAGATGTGTFKGVVNRRSWHVTLDATGSYHY